MKKVLLGLLAVSAVSMAADINPTNVYLKAGVDAFSRTSQIVDSEDGQKYTEKDNKGFKWEVALEATQTIMPEFELGLGVAYQDHGKIKPVSDFEDGEQFLPAMKSFPVYAIAKYNIPVEGEYKPYVFANLGYSFNEGKKSLAYGADHINVKYKSGMYYGVGLGVERDNFVVDLSYKLNKGKLTDSGVEDGENYSETDKLNYGRVTLGFGYKFSF